MLTICPIFSVETRSYRRIAGAPVPFGTGTAWIDFNVDPIIVADPSAGSDRGQRSRVLSDLLFQMERRS